LTVREHPIGDFVYKNIKLGALRLLRVSMRQSEAEAAKTVRIERINDLWAYVLPDDKLVTGSSYGNKKCFANSKATGAIENLFSLDLGRNVVGSTLIRYYDAESGILLEQSGPGNFVIHPA
jgi:hypothetical protein